MIDAGGVQGTTLELTDEWLARQDAGRADLETCWPGCRAFYDLEKRKTVVEFHGVPDISSMEW